MRGKWIWMSMAVGVLSLALSRPASAQVYYAAPAPVVAYYTPPVQAYYVAPAVPAPAVAATYVAPYGVTGYQGAMSYYPAAPAYVASPVVPATSYYVGQTSVVYPARVNYGLFGRTNVRTPYYKIKY